MNQYTVIGILAHVDAGKTTLSEALLFQAGVIRKQGRVDHKDAFLDTNPLERERGITIFSKPFCPCRKRPSPYWIHRGMSIFLPKQNEPCRY